MGSFHEILNQKLPGGVAHDNATILIKLEEAYREWSPTEGPRIWDVARAWLREKGVQ